MHMQKNIYTPGLYVHTPVSECTLTDSTTLLLETSRLAALENSTKPQEKWPHYTH